MAAATLIQQEYGERRVARTSIVEARNLELFNEILKRAKEKKRKPKKKHKTVKVEKNPLEENKAIFSYVLSRMENSTGILDMNTFIDEVNSSVAHRFEGSEDQRKEKIRNIITMLGKEYLADNAKLVRSEAASKKTPSSSRKHTIDDSNGSSPKTHSLRHNEKTTPSSHSAERNHGVTEKLDSVVSGENSKPDWQCQKNLTVPILRSKHFRSLSQNDIKNASSELGHGAKRYSEPDDQRSTMRSAVDNVFKIFNFLSPDSSRRPRLSPDDAVKYGSITKTRSTNYTDYQKNATKNNFAHEDSHKNFDSVFLNNDKTLISLAENDAKISRFSHEISSLSYSTVDDNKKLSPSFQDDLRKFASFSNAADIIGSVAQENIRDFQDYAFNCESSIAQRDWKFTSIRRSGRPSYRSLSSDGTEEIDRLKRKNIWKLAAARDDFTVSSSESRVDTRSFSSVPQKIRQMFNSFPFVGGSKKLNASSRQDRNIFAGKASSWVNTKLMDSVPQVDDIFVPKIDVVAESDIDDSNSRNQTDNSQELHANFDVSSQNGDEKLQYEKLQKNYAVIEKKIPEKKVKETRREASLNSRDLADSTQCIDPGSSVNSSNQLLTSNQSSFLSPRSIFARRVSSLISDVFQKVISRAYVARSFTGLHTNYGNSSRSVEQLSASAITSNYPDQRLRAQFGESYSSKFNLILM